MNYKGEDMDQHKDTYTFWMVYCEYGGSPKQKHESLEKAIEEAKRIMKKEGKRTYVLRCVGYLAVPIPEPVYKTLGPENSLRNAIGQPSLSTSNSPSPWRWPLS